jgi:hypothetical protein
VAFVPVLRIANRPRRRRRPRRRLVIEDLSGPRGGRKGKARKQAAGVSLVPPENSRGRGRGRFLGAGNPKHYRREVAVA